MPYVHHVGFYLADEPNMPIQGLRRRFLGFAIITLGTVGSLVALQLSGADGPGQVRRRSRTYLQTPNQVRTDLGEERFTWEVNTGPKSPSPFRRWFDSSRMNE